MYTVEFAQTCAEALATDVLNELTLARLEAALHNNRAEGLLTMNEILACLLLTVLEIESGPGATNVPTEFRLKVNDMPICTETASEVLRLYLHHVAAKAGVDKAGFEVAAVVEVREELEKNATTRALCLSQALKTTDFQLLPIPVKVQVLAYLCDQHFDNHEVVKLFDEKAERLATLRKDKNRHTRDRAAYIKAAKDAGETLVRWGSGFWSLLSFPFLPHALSHSRSGPMRTWRGSWSCRSSGGAGKRTSGCRWRSPTP
jgi:hypothetical protein